MMETRMFCPLGCQCERVVDDHIEQCAWFTEVIGKNPQTGEDVNDKKCSLAWLPILTLEQSRQTRSIAAALESHRNVVKTTGDAMMQIEREKASKAIGE